MAREYTVRTKEEKIAMENKENTINKVDKVTETLIKELESLAGTECTIARVVSIFIFSATCPYTLRARLAFLGCYDIIYL